MIKALKWAFDLGVRQERVRIAAELQMNLRAADIRQGHWERELVDTVSDEALNKISADLKYRLDVGAGVQAVIQQLFEGKGDWVPASVPMFPDDKHKGEM